MQNYPKAIQRLIDEFNKLPGIGIKSAKKLAFCITEYKTEDIDGLIEALQKVKSEVKVCKKCCNYSETDICPVCADDKRDHGTICVVEKPSDMMIVENTNEYNGLYHILHGVINPLEGIGIEDICFKELLERVDQEGDTLKEVIIATNPNTEGNLTGQYIASILKNKKGNLKITRIAQGLPNGGEMDYADESTILRAIEGRTEI